MSETLSSSICMFNVSCHHFQITFTFYHSAALSCSLLLKFSCRRVLLPFLPFTLICHSIISKSLPPLSFPRPNPALNFTFHLITFKITFTFYHSGALSCSLMLEFSCRRTLLPPLPFPTTKPCPSPSTSCFNRLISSI